MVMYTVNYAAGTYTLSDTPPVTKVLTQEAVGGQTDYLFTSTNIWNATMFAVQQGGGEWLGTLFFGRTTVDSGGQVGFLPDAQVEGSVANGSSADAFAVDYVIRHGSSEGLRDALFSGDDTLIGNGFGGSLFGGAGNDLIVSGGSNSSTTLDGGAGDDIIDGRDSSTFPFAAMGGRNIDFIYMDPNIVASGGTGGDTFFFTRGGTDKTGVATIADFDKRDHLQLDPVVFKALADGFTEENFVLGPRALDADDHLLFYQGALFYDPDGNGPHGTKVLARLSLSSPVTWASIVVSGDVPAAGDPCMAAHPLHHETHAFANAVSATGLLP